MSRPEKGLQRLIIKDKHLGSNNKNLRRGVRRHQTPPLEDAVSRPFERLLFPTIEIDRVHLVPTQLPALSTGGGQFTFAYLEF